MGDDWVYEKIKILQRICEDQKKEIEKLKKELLELPQPRRSADCVIIPTNKPQFGSQ